jgi:hypothetical protein
MISPTDIHRERLAYLRTIRGTWVDAEVVEGIRKARSAARSARGFGGIVTMIFDTLYSGDSLEFGVSISNHEGFSYQAYFPQRMPYRKLMTNIRDIRATKNLDEVGFVIKGADTLLYIYVNDPVNTSKIDSVLFIRVINDPSHGDAGEGIQRVANRHMIEGKYSAVDSLGRTIDLTFTRDGKLIGYPGADGYRIQTDFTIGRDNGIDVVHILNGEQRVDEFAIEVTDEITNLYKFYWDERELSAHRQGLLWRLNRIR